MSLEQIIERFRKFPKNMQMGAGKLAKRYSSSVEIIKQAKEAVRSESSRRIPKVLVFDIETAPMRSYIWGLWNNDGRISMENVTEDWFMICWSAKWLFGSEMYSDVLTPTEILSEDDARITASIWKLLDEADVVISHNGDRFDLPKLNTRFLLNGLNPVSYFKSIDTKKVAKGNFSFSSNKLNDIAKALGIGQKLHTEFGLWKRCMAGDEEALRYMKEYNEMDVQLLEDVYLRLRPWMKSHPNMALYSETTKPACACCGSEDVYESGHYYTYTGRYRTFRCKKCGGLSRNRTGDLPKEVRDSLLTSVPGR
jgi:hypothetical protein